MERRGATVLALDSTKNTRLLEAKALLGSRIDYHIGDICRLTAKDLGTFDIVLFLGVLYHLKHPLLALENVCGLCRDMACVESFVTDSTPDAIPAMEFYETAELRGQLDNWCGPNIACLLAFTRTAGFARVQFESVLAERAHVTAWRNWNAPEGSNPAPQILCVENSNTHDHNFSAIADDYLTFYFTHTNSALTCDNVYPEIGGFGIRPLYVAQTGGGWQASCKIPPGLNPGWHNARLRVEGSRYSPPLQIGIETPTWQPAVTSNLEIARIADGKIFESNRIRIGIDSAISVWIAGLPTEATAAQLRIRLNGTDLPVIWLAPEAPTRQLNAVLPAGLKPGKAEITVLFNETETRPAQAELLDKRQNSTDNFHARPTNL
jgi:hypothetical protein